MGRVAKYKKVKSFDPYSKQNRGKVQLGKVGVWGWGDNGRRPKKRSRRSEMLRNSKRRKKGKNAYDEGFDLPPTDDDDFDLNDIVGSVKKQKPQPEDESLQSEFNALPNGKLPAIPQTDEEEKKVAQVLRLESQVKKMMKKKEEESHSRLEGESKRAYARRTKAETRQIIQKVRKDSQNAEKRQRKKEFLNNKKKKKKRKGAEALSLNENRKLATAGNTEDTFITGENAIAAMADQVRFGEQVERPPIFRDLPRGAKAKVEKTGEASSSTGMTNTEIEAESHAMDILRRKVQARYAMIKAKRKQKGDFHV